MRMLGNIINEQRKLNMAKGSTKKPQVKPPVPPKKGFGAVKGNAKKGNMKPSGMKNY